MCDEWGVNPGTFQAVGGIATAVGLIIVIISANAALRQLRVAREESARRTRPWLQILDVRFLPGDAIAISCRNIGVLPAFEIAAQMTMDPSASKSGLKANPANVRTTIGTLFPNETKGSSFDIGSQTGDWVSERATVDFVGSLTYSFGPSHYATNFDGSLSFGHADVRILHWQHTECV